ncbi:GH16781 [Drosophila grimshawi]|uniref:GH16781 n=1 Tax=Drosophila grimshawi TaxID=7222 RepID=B4J3S7_DROGR|nr:GH16781 [Drosophila grimshawi]
MNSICLVAYFTVIAAVIATADHARHGAGGKNGDIVYVNIDSGSLHKSVTTVTTPKATTSTTATPTVAATDAKVTKEVKPTDATQAGEATTAGTEAVKHDEGETRSSVATVTTAAAPEVTNSTEKLIHKY